jgi:hypothetical protein
MTKRRHYKMSKIFFDTQKISLQQCCGSESGWLDQNTDPKKSSYTDTDSDPDSVVKQKYL